MTGTAAFAADVRVVEEIAVKVNGDIITRGDLAEHRVILRQQIQQQEHLTGPALDRAVDEQAKDMLREMIDERLFVQKAKELDIKVDADVNKYFSSVQVRSGFADPDKFHDWIHEQTGMSWEDFRQKTVDQYMVQRLVGSEVQSKINVPQDAMQKYYEAHKTDFVRKDEVFLSQILVSTEGKSAEQVALAEKKAQDLANRARHGEKFSDLARANSDDPETSKEGGQIPPRERGMMAKELDEKAFSLPKGSVLDPVKTPQGFFILRIDDRFDAGQESFDESKEEIQSILARPLMEPKLREFATKLRQQAFLEIKDGYVDTGAAPGKDTRWHEVVGLKPETTTKEEVAAHRRRPKFLGLIPHGSVAPGTKETSGSESPVETATVAPAPAAGASETAAAPAGSAPSTPGAASAPTAAPASTTATAAPGAPAPADAALETKQKKILGVIPHGSETVVAKAAKPEKPKGPPEPIKQ
jgi:parvulin-like peptidyl-prolyl isomerase